jgi:hypothetical protein
MLLQRSCRSETPALVPLLLRYRQDKLAGKAAASSLRRGPAQKGGQRGRIGLRSSLPRCADDGRYPCAESLQRLSQHGRLLVLLSH